MANPKPMRLATEEGRREPLKLAFTVPVLQSIKPPASGRTTVFDTRAAGLSMIITSTGHKAFYLYRRINGRPRRIKLGDFPGVTVEQARKLVAKLVGEIADGKDVATERQQARKSETFGELFARYMRDHATPKKRTAGEDQQKYDKYLTGWANRKAASITVGEVQALHARIGSKKPGAANRLLSLLSKVFNFGRLDNPAKGVVRFDELDRERFLQPDEMPKFFDALAAAGEPWADFFELALLTGARSGNLKSMRWADVNLDAALWIVPAIEFKTKKPMPIPLTARAMEILVQRKAAQARAAKQEKAEPSVWVFPAASASGHVEEPRKAWEAIQKASGLSDLHIHDLRRSMGSWQAATGANLSVIGKSLGHSNTSTTAIYARLNLDPVRAAVDTAAAAMLKAAKGKAKK